MKLKPVGDMEVRLSPDEAKLLRDAGRLIDNLRCYQEEDNYKYLNCNAYNEDGGIELNFNSNFTPSDLEKLSNTLYAIGCRSLVFTNEESKEGDEV